ncbi:MAG: hypothetical protein WAM58_08705 [Candidatus Acidiferrum sp.]
MNLRRELQKFALVLPIVLSLMMLSAIRAQGQEGHHKQDPPHYKITNLGIPLGGSFATGMSINTMGWVGGSSNLTNDTSEHAVVWRNGSAIDLGTLGGPNSALNGTYAGFSETTTADPLGQDFCAFGDYLICLPFALKFNMLTALPTLGGNSATAYDNNNFGQAIGVSQTSTLDPGCLVGGLPQAPFYEVQVFLPAVWGSGGVKALPVLAGDTDGEASGINNSGQIVGYSGNCLNPTVHALLWKNGQLVNLGSLGGVTSSAPTSINNRGEVTRNSDLPGDTTYHAFLWGNGTMTDLGTLPGDSLSYGNSINDKGQIVGVSCDASGNCRPFLWENGTMTDLNTLIPTSSLISIFYPASINNSGEITGYAYDATTGDYPAFLAVEGGGGEHCSAEATPRFSVNALTLPGNVLSLMQQHGSKGRFAGRANRPQ